MYILNKQFGFLSPAATHAKQLCPKLGNAFASAIIMICLYGLILLLWLFYLIPIPPYFHILQFFVETLSWIFIYSTRLGKRLKEALVIYKLKPKCLLYEHSSLIYFSLNGSSIVCKIKENEDFLKMFILYILHKSHPIFSSHMQTASETLWYRFQ